MNKLRIVIVMLAALALLLISVSAVWAVPPLPSSFYGEVRITDVSNPPLEGRQVLAYVPGVSGAVGVGTITTYLGDLVYSMDVVGDDTDTPQKEGGVENDPVSFYIDGRLAAMGFWHEGTNLNLVIHPPDPVVTSNSPVAEGSPVTINAGGSQDWGHDIITYSYDCGNDGNYEIGPQAGATAQCTFDDGPGTHIVAVHVVDAQGGVGTDTTTVVVDNVAPMATFNAPTSVNEGSALALSLTLPSDPSNADTAAGFAYAFDCGDGSGYGAWAATSTASCPTTDNGTRTVGGKVRDKNLSEREYTANVTINNVAPIATLSNNGPANEGSSATIAFNGQSDPSSADTTAGFHYAYACDGGALSAANYANTAGNTASTQCTFTDGPSTHTARARIIDKNDGFTEYSTDVIVDNVPPTVAISGASSVNEGATYTLNLSVTGDPGADTVNGWSINWGDGNVQPVSGNPASVTHIYGDGPNSYTISAIVTDEDGSYPTNIVAVTVNNVPPTVTIAGAASVNEGAAYTLNLTTADLGADTTSGWTINWGDGAPQAVTGNPASVNHVFADGPHSYSISATATDEDGTYNANTVAVVVGNVAPTATFNAPANVNEGSDINLSLTAPSDPGSADTATGFTYAFDCGSGYGSFGSVTTAACPTTDDGVRMVRGSIRDKDGGTTEYTSNVTINNVPPLSEAGGPYNGSAGQPVTLTGVPTCVPVDACSVEWSYGATSLGTTSSVNYVWNVMGDYTVTFRVTDNDGSVAMDTATVHITGAIHSIALKPGWNLVSFNLRPTNTSPAAVLNSLGTNYSLVYAWDATGSHSNSGNWLKYDRTAPFGTTLTSIDERMGFWIYITAPTDVTLNVIGSVPTSTDINFNTTAGGWNLVGYPAVTNRDLPGILSGIDFSLVYAYHANDTSDPWKLFDYGAPSWSNDMSQLSAGWGYWIKVNADGAWTVTYP